MPKFVVEITGLTLDNSNLKQLPSSALRPQLLAESPASVQMKAFHLSQPAVTSAHRSQTKGDTEFPKLREPIATGWLGFTTSV